MKKIFFRYLALGLMFIIPFACTDFLDEKDPNQLSTDSFWLTLDDCNTGLTAVYNSWKNGNVLAIGDEANRSDMTWPGWGRPNTTNQYYLQTFTDASSTPNNKWEACYKGIFRANQVIEGLTKILPNQVTPESQENATSIMAQARFLRGLFYSYLYNGFNKGSVIIYDFVPKDEKDFYQTVAPAEEVEKFFLADLEYAYQNLSVNYNNYKFVSDKGRVTKGAAAAVLGQHYLYQKKYDLAVTYLKDVITNPDYRYSLTANIGDNFTTKNEFNSESILEIAYSTKFKSEVNVYDEEQTSNTLHMMVAPAGTPGGYRSILPSCWLIMAYKNDKMDPTDSRNFVTDPVTKEQRLRKYSLRTSYSIALPDDPDLSYYGLTTAQAGQFNNLETSYFRKYSNWDIVTSEKPSLLRSGVNVRVIRLADVYLMYAEALIKGGTDNAGVAEAMRYINKVRYRSALQLLGMDGTGEYPTSSHDNLVYDASSLMNELMYVERPLELSIEGNSTRVIDLRRWNITKQRFTELSTQTYYAVDFPYVDATGKNATKWGSVLMSGVNPNPTGNKLQDYIQAAANYNEDSHGYWPLPSSESISNPVLR